ncbi:hypothetical protein [Ornithinicoccus halotolerans]|uniref:hypothetical protein n=1 Tax=Ornithinicoccus halotolerans TaxID=1748220 RepID=UPI001297A4C4|nr:hypothetical protein [Ornithinicoccus halotolerans]
MAAKGRALTALVKYGPVVYTAAQRYGPTVVQQLRHSPAEAVLNRRVRGSGHRRRALQHAGTVVDGSVQQVFHLSEPYWVVFSGEEPVGVHPHTAVPYERLLRNADSANRVRPEEAARTVQVRLPRRRGGRGGQPPQPPQPPQRPTA